MLFYSSLASSTISDWKTKKTNPSADKIMDICKVLGVTPEQLLTGKGLVFGSIEEDRNIGGILEFS